MVKTMKTMKTMRGALLGGAGNDGGNRDVSLACLF